MPGKGWVCRVKDQGFGTNSLVLLAKWDRDSLSWKTSQQSFLVESGTYSERFPILGTMRNGELSSFRCWRPHRRERLFIVAYARRGNVQHVGERGIVRCAASSDSGDGNQRQRYGNAADNGSEDGVANANGVREPQQEGSERNERGRPIDGGQTLAHANRIDADRRRHGASANGGQLGSAPRIQEFGAAESCMGGAAHGISRRVDRWPVRPGETQEPWEAPRTCETATNRAARLKALGNAVVPQVAKEVGHWLLAIASTVSK